MLLKLNCKNRGLAEARNRTRAMWHRVESIIFVFEMSPWMRIHIRNGFSSWLRGPRGTICHKKNLTVRLKTSWNCAVSVNLRCPYNSLHNNSLHNNSLLHNSLHNNSLLHHFATVTIRYCNNSLLHNSLHNNSLLHHFDTVSIRYGNNLLQ
jgi:hypothetical protein